MDLTVLTLGRFDTDKVYVTPTVPLLSLQRSNQLRAADTLHRAERYTLLPPLSNDDVAGDNAASAGFIRHHSSAHNKALRRQRAAALMIPRRLPHISVSLGNCRNHGAKFFLPNIQLGFSGMNQNTVCE